MAGPPLSDTDQRAVDIIARHGWMIQHVAPRTSDSAYEEEWFSYTVGLPLNLGWPEIICFGIERVTAQKMLNSAVEELKQHNRKPIAGIHLHDVLNGYAVRLVDFPECYRAYLGVAIWFARHSGLDFDRYGSLQLWWPDKHGRFPDDPDCNPMNREDQVPKNGDALLA